MHENEKSMNGMQVGCNNKTTKQAISPKNIPWYEQRRNEARRRV
jgi:hypothetical protein